MRLIRLNESEDKKIDKLLDAVLKVYEDDLTDDEIARLVSNLRKQAKDIINSREKVDVMINPDEEKVIHDWEDQVTTDKSPVTDDTEIVPAEKIARPDASTDEEIPEEDIEEEEPDTPEDLEHDPDYDEKPEETEDSDSDKDEESPEESPKESEDSEDESEKEEEDSPKEEEKEDKSKKSKKSAKNESFRLVRIRRR